MSLDDKKHVNNIREQLGRQPPLDIDITVTKEPVAKAGYFCAALVVSQAKALRNMHF
jgi:hypothetical protein